MSSIEDVREMNNSIDFNAMSLIYPDYDDFLVIHPSNFPLNAFGYRDNKTVLQGKLWIVLMNLRDYVAFCGSPKNISQQ